MTKFNNPFAVLLLAVALDQLFFNGFCQTNASDTVGETCTKWSDLAAQLSGSGRYQTCNSHPAPNCTRLDCSGDIRFSHLPLAIRGVGPIDIKYCFGAQLNSCNDPISMDFYLIIPDKNVSYEIRVDGDKMIKIPGFQIPLPIGHVSALLDFEFEKQRDGNIKFSVTSKARLYTNYGLELPLDQLDRKLINEETIHASPCNKKNTNPSLTPAKGFKNVACHEIDVPKPTTPFVPPPASSTLFQNCSTDVDSIVCSRGEICDTTKKTCVCKIEWRLVGQACVSVSHWGSTCGSRDDCGFNEICDSTEASQTPVCRCETGSSYNKAEQICKKGETNDVPDTPSASPHTSGNTGGSTKKKDTDTENTEDTSSNKTPIATIVGASVGGVIFLALIIAANAYVLRRIRKRRHEDLGVGLLTDDDTSMLPHDDDNDMIM